MCQSCETPAVTTADEAKTEGIDFVVQGMTCGGCAANVTNAVRGVAGVTNVSVDITDGRLNVTGDVDEVAISAAVKGVGYAVARA